jgi:asparagine synthase (glutamine-hydrolysing)
MFHYPMERVVSLQAEAMQLPLQLEHAETEEEELMLLEDTLAYMKDNKNITTVVTGAIASTYQRDRVNKICENLELVHFAPLWNMNQEQVLYDLIKEKFKIIITSVSAAGFDERWLGRKIDKYCIKDLKILNEKCGINLSGEGGEYCTTVLDCPIFKKKLKVLKAEKKIEGNERGFYLIKDVKLASK